MITKLSGKKIFPIGIGTWGMGGWMLADRRNDKKRLAPVRPGARCRYTKINRKTEIDCTVTCNSSYDLKVMVFLP